MQISKHHIFDDLSGVQPKSPLLQDETVCKPRAIGIQHANMSPKSDTRHFTWFLDVVHAFLSVSELLWTLFYYIKNVKLRP